MRNIHKRVIHRAYHKKHHDLAYIHIVLLGICFTLYNFTAFNNADDILVPMQETQIVIENEPQMIPDQASDESETSDEDVSNDILDQTLAESLQTTSTQEIMTGEVATESDLIQGEAIFLSGIINDLSGDVLYNISGDVVGEILIQSGEIIPVDMSGVSLIPQPLSVVYPEKSVKINASGYVYVDSIKSVVTTGGEHGVTYCSRIAYENISNMLKAGVWTYTGINNLIGRNDADQLITDGIAEKTITEVTREQLEKIFTGEYAAVSGSIYDMYATFMVNNIKTYHRIALFYAENGLRYVLDPLRGQTIPAPQKILDYLTYYDDEIAVHRYIGQAYSPLLIKEENTNNKNSKQLLEDILSAETVVIEEGLTGEIMTGTIVTGNISEWAEPVVPNVSELIASQWGTIATGTIATGTIATGIIPTEVIAPELVFTGEKIVAGYFTKAYDKGVYSEKIIELQKLLTRVQLYTGSVDGVYAESTIQAIYQYQLMENILTPQDSIALRGYLGPNTRVALNQKYIEYQISLLDSTIEGCKKDNMECRSQKLQEKLLQKGYELTKKGLVRLSNQALIGSETLDMSTMEGEFVLPIVLQSTNELSGQIAEVQIPAGALLKTSAGQQFMGELTAPKFLDSETLQESIDEEVLSVIDVGSDQHIQFEDENGNDLYATFRMPAPGMNVGDTIDVNYSEDGINRIYLDSVEVQLIDGEPYAIFEANHFTTFYLGNTTGTFTIANDATYVTGLAVTLNSSVTGATHMRFGNTIAQRDAASWVTYQSSSAWNLSGSDGIKRVYAQFSGNGVIRNVSDSIILDMSSGSMTNGLQLHIDGSTGATTFLDIGPRNLPFTIAGTAYKQTWSGENIMYFNGTNGYATSTSGFITAYPFTISARVKVGKITGTQGIVVYGNSATTTTYYGIQLVNAKASMVSRNTTARILTAGPTLTVGSWVHIVGVFNANNSRELYVNGASVGTQTSNGGVFSTVNPRWRLGAYPGSTTINYYSGNIDETRVYNKALNAAEVSGLYMDVPKFDPLTTYTGTPTLYGEYTPKTYLTGTTLTINGNVIATTGNGPGRWKTVPFTTGLAAGSYNVTLNYMNVYGKTGSTIYTNGLIVNTSGATISYNPFVPTTGNVISTLTGLDATYQIVNNSGSELRTFTGNGSFIYQFIDQVGTTGSITATVDWIKKSWLNYSTTGWFENSVINNGSISGNIVVTLGTGDFSGAVANYTTLSNLPSGLTGVVTLSGTKSVIITLSGAANTHASADSTGNISLSFLTGAFSGMNPSDVVDATKKGLSITFYDPAGFIAGQQLWLNGYLSGGQFYDRSPNHRTTTMVGSPTSTVDGGETVMSFDGNSQSITVGNYTLTDYSIGGWFKTNSTASTRRSVIGDAAGSWELSVDTSNRLQAYNNGTLTSIMTIEANTRYHAFITRDAAGSKMYINGVLDNSNTNTTTINNITLSVGNSPNYSQPWNGNIDEVKIYDTAITLTQVESLYMSKPSFTTKTTPIASPNLRGFVSDPKMTLSVTVEGIEYPATNNQDGTWVIYSAGPFSGGTYDVALNYTNVYGKTGMLYYTGGLIVNPTIYMLYTPSTLTSSNVIATVTGYTSEISVVNNGGLPNYTFTENGQFTFNLKDIGGDTFNITSIVNRIEKASISYSTGMFYENSGANDGSIETTIIATITGDTFASNIITNGYVQMANIPAGLTGSYLLSGNDTLIIGLTGNATNHTSDADINTLTIDFLSGAFTNYSPNVVGNTNQTGISIDFFDGEAGAGTLRLDGSNAGNIFYNLAGGSHLVTGYNSIGSSLFSGETIIGPFNGTNQYLDIGMYTLPEYSMSTRVKTNTIAGSYRSIIARNSAGTAFEISINNDKISLYTHGITSNITLTTNKWYHIVVVKDTVGTKLYVDGVLDSSNGYSVGLVNTSLSVGRWNTSQYRDGNIDEVRIFDTPLTSTQVEGLYLQEATYIPTTIEDTTTPILTGGINDPKMYSVSVTISGTTYATTLAGGERTSNAVGPLANGIYDIQLDYTNVYGATETIIYTGGLTINVDTIKPTAIIEYSITGLTDQDVIATVTGFSEAITGLNVSGHTFTENGLFEFIFSDLAGNTGNAVAMVTWIQKPVLSYSVTGWLENPVANNGTISGNIIVTLSTGSFSNSVANYVSLSNIPIGLTPVITLSEPNKVVVELTGFAVANEAINSVESVSLSFLTGAFSGMNPKDVSHSTQTGISVFFYDNIPGERFRLDGSRLGTRFYDITTNNSIFTGYGNATTTTWSGENVIQLDGVGDYVQNNEGIVGGFPFTVSTRARRSVTNNALTEGLVSFGENPQIDNWRGLAIDNGYAAIIAQGAGGTEKKLTGGPLFVVGQWYHLAAVFHSATSRTLYVNGIDVGTQNTDPGTLSPIKNWTLGARAGQKNSNLFSGWLDEVRMFAESLTATQVESLYMVKPSFTTKHTPIAAPNLRGFVTDPKMTLSVTVEGIEYPATNNQDGTWVTYAAGPFSLGAHDIQLNYMNVYGRTGVINYPGGLVVDALVSIIYNPAISTFSNVVATLTGYDNDIVIINNGGLPTYTFTGNGQFTFNLKDIDGDTFNITAVVDWMQDPLISYSTDIFYEEYGTNNGTINTTMIATLQGDTFAANMISNGLVQMTNVPQGLTGVYTLIGNDKVVIGFTGKAINHTNANSVSNISIQFLTGAFSSKNPSSIANSTKTGVNIEFHDIISGEKFRLDGSRLGTRFYDVSISNSIFTGYGNVTTTTWSGENVMQFDGNGDYVDNKAGIVPGYPFTVSTRARPSRTETIAGLISFGQNPEAGNRRGLGIQNGYAAIMVKGAGISTEQVLRGTEILTLGKWYHIAAVFNSSTSRTLYVNGVAIGTQTTNGGTIPAMQNRRIGARAGQTNNNMFSGWMDEVHMFADSLNDAQIEFLYMQKPNYKSPKVTTTDTTILTGLINDPKMYSLSLTVSGKVYTGTLQSGARSSTVGPLTTGTYNVQLNYMNVYGKTGMLYYTGGLIVTTPPATGALAISGPVNFDFGLWDITEITKKIEKTFSGSTDYFKIIDDRGTDDGYYTTISVSNMTNESGDNIPYTAIAIKSLSGIETLAGTNNPRVVSAITGTYQYFSNIPILFMQRAVGANYGVKGSYGLHTQWQIDVPSMQNPGAYSGLITYTLY